MASGRLGQVLLFEMSVGVRILTADSSFAYLSSSIIGASGGTENNIYCGFINTVGSYIHLSHFHLFQPFFIHIDIFFPFSINFSSNLHTLYNVEKIVWPTVYAVFGVANC
jgi:hypothetical protein